MAKKGRKRIAGEELETWINKHYIIRVYPKGKKSRLISAKKLKPIIGTQNYWATLRKAFESKKQVYIRRLRSGYKIEFQSR